MAHIRPGAVILLGPERVTAQERLMDRALRAAALDLIATLRAAGFETIVAAGPELAWLPGDTGAAPERDVGAFHFGARLAGLIERHALDPVFYFGAGSAPLVSAEALAEAREALCDAARQGSPRVITNNLHSADWCGIAGAAGAFPTIRAAARDNALAWSLREAGFPVQVAIPSGSAAALDLDTPADVAIARLHPACGAALRRLAVDDPSLASMPVAPLIEMLCTDGARVALIGRVGPRAWEALSAATLCWIRAYSEERGMVASERLARGEVRSLVGRLIDLQGPEAFFAELAQVADAAVFDTRVVMAAAGRYPGDGDRFASDLLRPEWVRDPWVRDLTVAARGASIPVLLGGHGVVAGGLSALADIVRLRRSG